MKDKILQILEAIDYEDDREEFVNKFINIIQIEIITHLLHALPQDQQDKIENDFAEDPDPEKFIQLFKAQLTEEQMQKETEEATQSIMTGFINSIAPTLSPEQKQKVA